MTPNELPVSDVPTANQYGDVAAIYDALMEHVPHGHWLSRIEKEVRLRERRAESALDIACGTGIVTERLFQRGYRPVVGFDLSPAMIAIARTKAAARGNPSALRYTVSDAVTLDLPERFDLLVSLFDSLNYILEPDALQEAFHRFYRHTNRGGMIAFDLNAPYALRQNLFTQSQHFGPVQHNWVSFWDERTQLCRVEMDFWVTDEVTGDRRHFHETHVQRAYSPRDIFDMLTGAGYSKVSVYGNYGDYPPGPKSDRLLFTAQKDD
ncbi:MAG: class I SAM-dependent methyltransferase [Capsulimonadales bacterium]|nr:class I SAM-dependent methyltransferase [Capsulimonadales bacterium]